MREGRLQLAPHAQAAVDWLREAASPPPGVSLRADDGSIFTGIALVQQNKVVLMLAVREPGWRREPERPPIPLHQTIDRPEQRTRSLWDHEHRWRDDDDWRR